MTSGKGLQVLPTIVIEQHELLSLYEMSYFCWKRVEFVSLFFSPEPWHSSWNPHVLSLTNPIRGVGRTPDIDITSLVGLALQLVRSPCGDLV